MRLNIHIVCDALTDLNPTIQASTRTTLDLVGVRYYQHNSVVDPSYLYLITPGDLLAFAQCERPVSVIFISPNQEELPEGIGSIQVTTECDMLMLFERLQSLFDHYNAWHEDVLKAALYGDSLQAVFDKASSVLHNAIALIDIMQSLVMKAGQLPADISGSIWSELLNKGFARLENLSIKQRREMNESLWSTEEPFFLAKVSSYSDARHLIAPLHNEGKPFAMLGMSDYDGTITLGQVSLVKIVQDLMKQALLSDIGKQHLVDHVGYYVDRILQGYLVERGALAYSLGMRNWGLADLYQVLFLEAKDNTTVAANLRSVQTMRVQNLFPSAYVFPYENGVLVILRDPESWELGQILEELEQLCKSLEMQCGVSMPQSGFLQIREAYLQATAALRFSGGDTKSSVLHFQEHYLSYLIGSLESAVDIASLCHPKILRQWMRGGEKGKALVETLRNYLDQGKNTNATARAMGLHRNTIIYRLERLQEVLGDDLESTDFNMHLMLLMSCLCVERLQVNRGQSTHR